MLIQLIDTNLVHLEQCTLAHLLQRTDFPCFLFAGKVDLSVTSLPNLSDNVELIYPQLSPSTPQQYPFTSTVRPEFLRMFGRRQVSRGGVRVELFPTFFPRRDVTQKLEIIVEEIYGRATSTINNQNPGKWERNAVNVCIDTRT
jgi:hypothetical protein